MLKDVKCFLNIPTILIHLRIFALSFRWRMERETLQPRAAKMHREEIGSLAESWRASFPFLKPSRCLTLIRLCPISMSNTDFYPQFRPATITYVVYVKGLNVFETKDFELGCLMCNRFRELHPRCDKHLVRLQERWQ